MNSISAAETIENGLDHWKDCEGLPEMTLLRFALIREFIKKLHSEKSKCLASGKKSQVQEIKEWESRLDQLRDLGSADGPLIELLKNFSTVPKKKRLLPEGLFVHLEREKLIRYDRKWEQCLAGEAAALGWSFWQLDTWIKINLIEPWDQLLSETLWPHGLVLFVESSGFQTQEDTEPDLWRGHWNIVLHPNFKKPAELSLNLSKWPGTPLQPPDPPTWKLIYSSWKSK